MDWTPNYSNKLTYDLQNLGAQQKGAVQIHADLSDKLVIVYLPVCSSADIPWCDYLQQNCMSKHAEGVHNDVNAFRDKRRRT